ncbi:hypothetical protein RHECNPAF_770035 [Rhizobium etli CNPAF512]|nr:hypothetical protein RHECNPAF_770035 [Rhizobium etli CNPAF512]
MLHNSSGRVCSSAALTRQGLRARSARRR